MDIDIKSIISLRHRLHAAPELSGRETATAELIAQTLQKSHPQRIITGVGGNGVIAVFKSPEAGPGICFRADIDALPIAETGEGGHISRIPGRSHACGHDGHSAILLGFAQWLNAHPEKWSGSVILLFQPAEETAQGALAVLADQKFTDLRPDIIFGMHNLPGFPLNSIILRERTFASASCGLKIRLTGKTSHAGHPEDGKSPLLAMLGVIDTLKDLTHSQASLAENAMVTIIHARLGEEAFGTSPGEAEVMATFRAWEDATLRKMTRAAEEKIAAIAGAEKLKLELKWVEKFAATVNDPGAVQIVERAAKKAGMPIMDPATPFPWSEDFSFFTGRHRCAFFGLGAGERHPRLHNPDYDFPDELIPRAIGLYANILGEIKEQDAAHKLD